jgi:hypothetical protein
MSADRDTTRIVRSWLRTEEHESADRVLDAVLEAIDTTPQRRATWWPARRISIMNTTLKFGLAAVVVAVAVLIGVNYFAAPNVGGPGLTDATPSPTPSLEPTPTPTATPDSGLPVGPYLFNDNPEFGPRVTVTIPAPGWTADDVYGVLIKNERSDPPDGAAIIGPFAGEFLIYGDPCEWSSTVPDAPATTVDEVVAALAAQASRDASDPVDITVDGYAGRSIVLHVPDDQVDSDCDSGQFASWEMADSPEDGPDRYHQGPGQIDEMWVLDVDGVVTVMDAMYGPETPAEHVDELRAILQSMTFGE